MGKHAYCIIAHNDRYCLERLISLIDDPRNDIFLLIDRKASPRLSEGISTTFSKLTVIPEEEQIDIRWGGLSQVKAELLLFKKVNEKGSYDYLHLLSGMDLPLKTQDHIHNYFGSLTTGTNIVAFSHGKSIEENVAFKTRYRHPFVENQRFRKDGNLIHFLTDFYCKSFRTMAVAMQKVAGIKRKWKGIEIKKGSNWVSITGDFAAHLVKNENSILKKFRGVICADEIFLQTELYNSDFSETVLDFYGEKEGSLRKIDWERGNPYIWRKKDFRELMESEDLFARKFSSDTDKEIIDMIYQQLKNRPLNL